MRPASRTPAVPRMSRDGWPLPPPIRPAWMARRAQWWLHQVRGGRVQRFHADIMALQGGFVALRGRRPLLQYGEALRQEWRARTEAGPAGPALARADHPNYLGSPAVVRGLVDGYVALLIARAGGAVPHEACEAEIHRLALAFAGRDPGYAAIGGWNTPGQLGASVAARCPLPEPDGTELPVVLAEMFAFVGLAVLRVLRAAEAGGLTADAALGRLKALAQRASAILLGLADVEPAGATLAALVQDLPELS